MKALTVLQPWASLIAIGAKRIETRSWYTNYRGPLAIHAGKKMTHEQVLLAILDSTGRQRQFQNRWDSFYTLGCVIATATMLDCLPMESYRCLPGVFDDYPELDTPEERACGDFSPGRWAWVLTDVKPLEKPIPAKGAQGLWNWNGGVR